MRLLLPVLLAAMQPAAASTWLEEPVQIGTRPQLFVDDALVDNRFAMHNGASDLVLRKFHEPLKFAGNPVMVDPDPEITPTYQVLRYDAAARLYRMWYTAVLPVKKEGDARGLLFGHYHVRYAESDDAIHWRFPHLGLYLYKGNRDNNIVFAHPKFEQMEMRAERRTNWIASPAPVFLNETDMPEADLHGYKYLLTYPIGGSGPGEGERNQVFMVGSKDGIHWDREHQQSLGFLGISDGWFGMVYDPITKKYVAFVRPRDRYQRTGNTQTHVDFQPTDLAYTGIVRRIARVESDSLWHAWDYASQTVLLTDEQDRDAGSTALMSISMRDYAGIYFGFLEPFVPRKKIWTELVVSRDGKAFDRLHSTVVAAGADGAWDAKQAWASSDWLEVGNEWYIYYWASNREPNMPIQDGRQSIGMAKIRKEGFLSLNVPTGGGEIVTRELTWPGGDLLVNCSTPGGEMRVRVSNRRRDGIEGFDFKECEAFTGDDVAHRVTWKNHSLDELTGQPVRLEFYFEKSADLYGFRATGHR